MTYGSFLACWTGPYNNLRIYFAAEIQPKDLQLCSEKPRPPSEQPKNETTYPNMPQLNPVLAAAWQGKDHSWSVEQNEQCPWYTQL